MARVTLALFLLLSAGPAWADPFSLLATAVVQGFGLTGLAALGVYAVGGLLRTSKARKDAKKARAAQIAAYNASLQDRTTQFASAESTERYVYGSPAPIAGNIVANFVSGDKDQFRHLVIYLASHECQACDGIYIDGVNIGALDGDGWVTGGEFFEAGAEVQAAPVVFSGASVVLPQTPVAASVAVYMGEGDGSVIVPHSLAGSTVTVSAPYDTGEKTVQYRYTQGNARVRVNMHLSPGGVDTADAGLIAAVPSKWTSAHKASNTTYAVVTLDLRMARFQGGPPTFTFKLRGKKVYDPRTLATAYSANPILCTMDYMRSRHGGGVALAKFDASWVSAANSADTAAYTAAPNTGNTTELFRCDGVFTLDQGRDAIIAQFEAAFSGEVSESAGLWRVRAGVWAAPVLTLGDADIFGFVEQLQGGFPLEKRFNGARGQYLAADGLGVPQDAKPYSNATFLAADGAPRIDDVPMGFIGSEQRAQHAMRLRVERSRGGLTLRVPASPVAWPLQPGDRVTLTYSPYGITSRTFRVTGWGATLGGTTGLELERDEASIWDLADATTAYTQPTTDLPSGFVAPALSGLAADSGDAYLRRAADGTITTGVRLTWVASDDAYVVQGGRVEFQTRSALDADGAWQAHPSEDGAFSFTTLYGLQDGLHYIIRARFVNQRGVPGNWATLTHRVVGKTAPPPVPQDFGIDGVDLLSWSEISREAVPDLAGYLLRFHYGVNQQWGTATPLHEGIITDTPYRMQVRPSGLVTIMLKSIDTSKIESESAAVVVADLGQAPIANVLETIDFDALGYPGTISGGSVSGGDVLASLTNAFWSADSAASFWSADSAAPFWRAAAYDALQYTSDVFQISAALSGSVATLELDYVGDGLVVEYRRLGTGAFWSSASSGAFWSASSSGAFWGEPTPWLPWPGQLVVQRGPYQMRVSLASGGVQSRINAMALVIDAPDIVETVSNVALSASGTVIPFNKPFTSITNIAFSLQAATSGAVGVSFNKTNLLAPVATAINGSNVPVSGASADFTLRGY